MIDLQIHFFYYRNINVLDFTVDNHFLFAPINPLLLNERQLQKAQMDCISYV